MGLGPHLSPHAFPTAASQTYKQEAPHARDGEARPSSHSPYRRQRVASRALLLPVGGMAMAKGSDTPHTSQTTVTTSSSSTTRPRRKHSHKLNSDDLPAEAAALKRRIWESHPRSAYKFHFGKLRRVVRPPVEIPAELADPTVLTHIVSGKAIPLTKLMWEQQRDLFKLKRLPSRIREGCAY